MTNKTSVLVVDDEPAILRFLKPAMEANNYEIAAVGTVAEALKRIASDAPDIVVLDLGLPDGDGKDVIQRVREWSDVPIVVLSARDREIEKIQALDLGADDFVNKPFAVGELLARLRVAFRRSAQAAGLTPLSIFRTGDIEVDLKKRRILIAGAEVHLTRIEYKLFEILIRHSDQVVTHGQLLKEVWGPNHEEQIHYLRVYMLQLRRKLEADPTRPRYLRTEPGVGYRLATE